MKDLKTLGLITVNTPINTPELIDLVIRKKSLIEVHSYTYTTEEFKIACIRPQLSVIRLNSIISLLNEKSLSELILSDSTDIPEYVSTADLVSSPYKGLEFLLQCRLNGISVRFVNETSGLRTMLDISKYIADSHVVKKTQYFDAKDFLAREQVYIPFRDQRDEKSSHITGRVPYGYYWDREYLRLTIVPEEANIIRAFFDLLEQGKTYSEILSAFIFRDYRTRKGTLFSSTQLVRIRKREDFYRGLDTDNAYGDYDPILDGTPVQPVDPNKPLIASVRKRSAFDIPELKGIIGIDESVVI